LIEPAHLFFPGAAVMHFADDHWDLIPMPGLPQALAGSDAAAKRIDAHGLDIHVDLLAVRAGCLVRVAAQTMIEKALARQVMIDADDVRTSGPVGERVQCSWVDVLD